MLRITSIIIVVLVSTSQCYGFNIGEIFTDFASVRGNDHTGHRFKREPQFDMECCGEPPNEENMAMMKKCFESVSKMGEPKSDEDMLKFGLKFVECLLIESGVFTSKEGLVDKAKFSEIMSKQEPDEWRRKQMEDQYEDCMVEAKQMATKFKEMVPDADVKGEAAGFFHCQIRGVIRNCPSDKYKDNTECNNLKEMLEKRIDEL